MFALRAIAAILSIFAITYICVSIVVLASWRPVSQMFSRRSGVAQARALYALRLGPLVLGALVALLYEFPSFLRFEPSGISEALSPLTLIFSIFMVLFTAVALWRMRIACAATAEICRTHSAEQAEAPLLAVAGAFDQRLLVSRHISALLQEEELTRALAHETAHLRSRDNLRKLMLLASPFPGMAGLEHAWADAAEFAADERAVSTHCEALALASAIVKVASVSLPSLDSRALVTNFVAGESSTAIRIQRLIRWEPARISTRRSKVAGTLIVATVAASAILSYSGVLFSLHLLTEILFR